MYHAADVRSHRQAIQHAVWLYARFTLSFRDVEDLLAERGIEVSNETVRRWFLKFGQLSAGNLRRGRPCASARWHLDEMVIKIRGRNHWLWRAVDDEGEVLDFLVQPRRCARSAQRLLRKLLKKQGFAPKRITTDKLKSYAVAIRKERLIPTDVSHDTLAQLRFVIEAIRCGIAIRSFHAVQQASTIAS